MTSMHIIGIAITLIVIIGLSIYSGSRVKNAADFASGGGKSGSLIIAGTIMGTLVGGSSTVGTAQLAYNYGMSAWWFTLGGGIACLILALGFVRPFRSSGSPTLVGIVAREYGNNAGMLASVFSSVGIFINILSQLISATAVIAVIAPKLGIIPSLIIAAVLMVLYVTLGGIKGAGMVGIVKLILLYFTVAFCGIATLVLSKGLSPLIDSIKALQNETGVHYFNLFAQGIGKDLGAGLSLVLGVLTTQTYAQAVMSGKTDSAARRSALISTFMIPPVGIGGILVGLYMRVNNPGIVDKTALTYFIVNHVPTFLGGIMLAALLVAVVGTGAGLALGISTIINNDIVKTLTRKFDDPKKNLWFTRACIVLVLAIACVFAALLGKNMIQTFAYMSMGLRGAVMFVPLLAAIWAKGRINKKFIVASIVISPVVVLVFGIIKVFTIDSLFVGIAFSLIVCLIGFAVGKNNKLKNG